MNKKTLEKILNRKDLIEYFADLPKEKIEEYFGKKFSVMKDFDQNNCNHEYDLLNHILHTVESIDDKDLKVAAFCHDIGKPDVVAINPNTKQNSFYGHSAKSAEISAPILKEWGYSQSEILQICFYIKHHDDFISYKPSIENWMKDHIFIREITAKTVAEKLYENMFDFEHMNYTREQIRYICSYSVNGEEPNFLRKGKKVTIGGVYMDDVKEELQAHPAQYIPTLKDYQKLMKLCKADANAQAEVSFLNGKVVATRAGKLENLNNIEKVLEAYLINR